MAPIILLCAVTNLDKDSVRFVYELFSIFPISDEGKYIQFKQ